MSRTSTVTPLYHGLFNRHRLPEPSHPTTACLPAPSHCLSASTPTPPLLVCQHPHTPPLLVCQHPHTPPLLVCQHPHTPPQLEQALSASTLTPLHSWNWHCLPAPSHPSTAGTGIVCQHPHTPPQLEQALSASTLHCCHPVWPTSVYAVEWSSTHTGPHTRVKKRKCEKPGWEQLKPSVRGDRGSKASGSLSTPALRLAWRLSGFTIE